MAEKKTWEEYLKMQETFGKIEDPEIIKSLKRQHQNFNQRIDDLKYLEPHGDHWLINEDNYYHQLLNEMFRIEELPPKSVRIFIQPSFEPEHMLTINTESVELLEAPENIWESMQKEDPELLNMQLTRTMVPFSSDTIGDRHIISDLEEAIFQAREPKSGYMTLDGVKYYFIMRSPYGSKLNIASKHSPDEDSPTGWLVCRLELMINSIRRSHNQTTSKPEKGGFFSKLFGKKEQ